MSAACTCCQEETGGTGANSVSSLLLLKSAARSLEPAKRVPMFRVEAGFSSDPAQFAAQEAASRREAFAKAKAQAVALSEEAKAGGGKSAKQQQQQQSSKLLFARPVALTRVLSCAICPRVLFAPNFFLPRWTPFQTRQATTKRARKATMLTTPTRRPSTPVLTSWPSLSRS